MRHLQCGAFTGVLVQQDLGAAWSGAAVLVPLGLGKLPPALVWVKGGGQGGRGQGLDFSDLSQPPLAPPSSTGALILPPFPLAWLSRACTLNR